MAESGSYQDRERRWQDWLILVAGVWLVASPWVLGFSEFEAAMWSTLVSGALIAAAAGWALGKPDSKAPEYVNILLGLILIAAPWIFTYAGLIDASWNAWTVGAIVVICASWAMQTGGDDRTVVQ